MKLASLTFCLIMSQCLFSQDFLMDSIAAIQGNGNPTRGEVVCTSGFWDAERDGGQRMFKQVSRLGPDIKFKMSDKTVAKNRAVIVVDFMRSGEKRDEIYLFAVKTKGIWLMDGFNEAKAMIQPFLEDKCSGHFNPTSIPSDDALEKIANEMIKYTKDPAGLTAYLKSVTTSDSDFHSVMIQFTDRSYDGVKFMSAGYSEDLKKGYIYFDQLEDGDSSGDITMYFERTDNSKHRVTGYAFTKPNSLFFFK